MGPDLERAIRKANLSPADLARFAGVSPRWLGSVMAGAPIRPDSKKLARLTEAIGLLGVEPRVSQLAPVPEPDTPLARNEPPGACSGELAAAAGAISTQTASLLTLARNVADLTDTQARLDRTLSQLVAALDGLLAVPAAPEEEHPHS